MLPTPNDLQTSSASQDSATPTSPKRPAQLRSDLVRHEGDAGAVQLEDPVSLRRFSFDETQSAVLELLDGETLAQNISEELFGDAGQEEHVTALIERVRSLGLLTQEPALDSLALRRQQAQALRGSAARGRDARIAASVRWAHEHLPFYREQLEGLTTDVHGVADLPTLPMTTKRDIRENFPARLLPKELDVQELVDSGQAVLSTTSGSTGGRLQYLYDLQRKVPATLALEPGYSEDRNLVLFTTPICSGQVCHRGGIPFEDRLLGETRLTLNSSERVMQLSREHVEEVIADIARHGASEMYVDPVYMAALVRAFQKYELPLPTMHGIRTGFEYLTNLHRDILSEAFGVPIRSSYGATDLGGPAAIACEHGRFHAMENSYVFEFVKDGVPVEWGQIGELVATSIRHPYTRLIRYRVGDIGRPIEHCGCAWDDWPAFEIEGRLQDVIRATDGSRVTSRAVDDLFKGLSWLDFYQLTQKTQTKYQLLAMRRDGVDTHPQEAVFLERLHELIGADAEVRLQYVRELPIEQSFKYPLTKQKSEPPLTSW